MVNGVTTWMQQIACNRIDLGYDDSIEYTVVFFLPLVVVIRGDLT